MDNYTSIFNAIQNAERIVITSHRSPDGDSIGSSMGLYHFLQKLGKNVVVCHPDPGSSSITWVEGYNEILFNDLQKERVAHEIYNCDLLFSLDYNAPSRVGKEMEPLLRASTAQKILIDHHPFPDADFFSISISDTNVGSTSELIFQLIESSGNLSLVDSKIGTPLYMGIMTDTGSFRFPSVRPETHEILAKLMRAGVSHFKVHEQVFDSNSMDQLKLRGYAISEKLEVIPGKPIALISLNEQELLRFNYQKGDTDGLVNVALSIEGIQVAVFFVEKDGAVKISFRSKGDYFVNELANAHFEGGGHKYAAGGISHDGIVAAIEKFKSLVYEYFPV